ncbi:hypothetical protein GCM10022631_01740 [Deinococcus rubellus]|uniref:Uncharacterized protein n=1 Tax=Deinococcus rubellus TaxID=1889240 RepID=A0ABY5YI19_9DEIO|nr:hypothetical protein [Deinococcus rubellus]UWX64755.1 hypothetical protein N0D28_03590 [Deinococcus rubellus]
MIDLGTLQASQSAPERVKYGHYRITWDADYAAATFLGAVFKKRRGSLPARNVPMNVLREFDFSTVFAQEWK